MRGLGGEAGVDFWGLTPRDRIGAFYFTRAVRPFGILTDDS